jgi:hypothetical protein
MARCTQWPGFFVRAEPPAMASIAHFPFHCEHESIHPLLFLPPPGGPATLAKLNTPMGLTSDGAGGILITDRYVTTLRRLLANGTLILLAGTSGSVGSTGNGGPATQAKLSAPFGGVIDSGPSGGIFIAVCRNGARGESMCVYLE